VFKELQAPF